jgi:hypothetical protein
VPACDDVEAVASAADVEREVREEGDVELLAAPDNVFPPTVRDVEVVLHRRDRDDTTRTLELVDRDVREPDVADLALAAELGERTKGLLEWDAPVGRMQLVEVDSLEPKAPEAAFTMLSDRLRPAVVEPFTTWASR